MKTLFIVLTLLVATACTTVDSANNAAPKAETKATGMREARQAALLEAVGN